MVEVAIIGSSGLYDLEEITDRKEISVRTPFGAPSDKILTGKLNGVKVAFLCRHNRGYIYLPKEIPNRANIYALKKLGVKSILAFSAAGSLTQACPPSTFVFPDQLVDRTSKREDTFLGEGLVGHMSFADPFCNCLQHTLYKEAKKLKIPCADKGTIVCIEGPAFSTRAESDFHRKMGWHLVGMTVAPEAKLAREAGLSYGHIAMVTDFDAWKQGEEVTSQAINEVMKTNQISAQKLIFKAVLAASKLENCKSCNKSMFAAITAGGKKVNKARLNKIKGVFR